MSRYVEKEAFIALLNKRIYCLCGGETVKETKNIRDMLEVFPAADVAPVARGEWIEGEYVGEVGYEIKWHCSSCGFAVLSEEYPAWHYCPNCGAEMEGDDEHIS
jgi:rubrerythrin